MIILRLNNDYIKIKSPRKKDVLSNITTVKVMIEHLCIFWCYENCHYHNFWYIKIQGDVFFSRMNYINMMILIPLFQYLISKQNPPMEYTDDNCEYSASRMKMTM
jgi:hypothetical protein